MTQVTFQGNPVSVSGKLPAVGEVAPAFTLCAGDLSDLTLEQLHGKIVVLNIFPSVDTGVCATSVRKFNESVANEDNTVILCVSADLPFAFGRFCAAEGIDKVKGASFFRNKEFTENYGVNLNEGPLRGLSTRAVVVINQDGIVVHSELVSEIADEPNYESALQAVKNC